MLFNNDKAVSPIVATLVLIVVAIAGAAAVGTIMGSFSSDVSDSASADQAASSASTELLIAGSTTVQPVSEKLAEAYMDQHPGVKVTVQGGGSDAGIAGANMDVVDIGSASKNFEATDYPDLNNFQIGGSGVVVICNGNVRNVNLSDLNEMYANAVDGKIKLNVDSNGNITEIGNGTTGTAYTLYQRAEGSGTEECFAKGLGNSTYDFHADKDVDHSSALGEVGNQGVADAVDDTENSIGFCDYGFSTSLDHANTVNVSDSDGILYIPTKDNIKAALKGDYTKYEKEFARPLNYITNGEPSSLEKSYIDFAMSPGAVTYFDEVGYFSIMEL